MTTERLERALTLWLECAAAGTDGRELLARHPDLRDLLEPLFAEVAPEPAPASRLGDFDLLRELGRGGMGVVWEARQRSLDRRVALKLLAPALTVSPAAVARLKREAATAARLNHPNLVKVLGLGREGEVHFLALELVDGEPIDRRPRPVRETVALIAQVADALDCVHRAGIVHRDVKPANVLVTATGNAVLTDFGLARDASVPSMSVSGAFAGTPEYASPEQLRGARVGATSDVFSLGVTLFELLTGTRPYPGATPGAVIEAIADAPVAPDPRSRQPELARELAAVVRKAIAPQPTERYASAAAFAADLRAWHDGRAVEARPPALPVRVWRWSKREPWRAALVAVLVVAVPLLAGLIGHRIATQPLVRAGEALALEQQVEQRLADAYLAVSIGEIAPALRALDEALALDPTHREARAIRDLVAAPAQARASPAPDTAAEPEDALLAALQAAVRHLLDTPARELRASAEEFGDWRSARAAIPGMSRAARLSPRPRLPIYALLASVTGIGASVPTAREAAETLAAYWPSAPAARRARARAMRCFDPAGAVTELAALVAESPRDVQLRFELVGALCRLGDKARAAHESRPLTELAPDDAMAWVCLAEHLLKSGQPGDAIAPYRRALALDDRNAATWYNLGVALSGADDEGAAREAFRRCVALDAREARAWTNLAGIALTSGEHETALDCSQRAIAADPDLEPASFNLRSAANELARFDLVAAELARRAARRSGDAGTHKELAGFLLEHPELPGAHADALRAALHALALSGWTDGDAQRLSSTAWQELGVARAAEITAALLAGTHAAGK